MIRSIDNAVTGLSSDICIIPFLCHCPYKQLRVIPFAMSLPVIKSFPDCTKFDKTVLPYIPQLYDLAQQVLQSVTNPQALKVLYISTNPLVSAFAFSLFLAPVFFVAGEINRNYSQVDRFWSLLPTLYNAHFVLYAHAIGLPTARLDALLIASVLWSVSLLKNLSLYVSLILLDAVDFQLLAQRWLYYWIRRLSMGNPSDAH